MTDAEIKKLISKEVKKILTETKWEFRSLSNQGFVNIRPSRGPYKKAKDKK